jgi:N-acetylglucosamine-6-phosphate deacetylase
MKPVLIENAELINPGVSVSRGSLLVADGKISAINPVSVPQEAVRIDAAGRRLTPGLIDMHTHGVGTFMYESPESMDGAARFAASRGTTCAFPTVVPVPGKELLPLLDALVSSMDKAGGARLQGLHLEGPFMAVTGAACTLVDGDVTLLAEMIAACRGKMSIMSLSPDTKNIVPVIERLMERGIKPFITHTRCTAPQAQAAIAAGARHATHYYDVFHSPPEYEPGVRPMGVIEAIMADTRTTVDFICDGCHVPPLVVQAWTTVFGWKRIMLITDSNIGAGLPAGVYDTPWGYKVRVKPGDGARIAEGPKINCLAGSALTMDVGMENLLAWLPTLPVEQVWAMGSLNPARLMGLASLGRLEAGAAADLVLWSDETRPLRTWVDGNCVFESSKPS